VVCWGRFDVAPTATGIEGARDLDVGASHLCAVQDDGGLRCIDAFEDPAIASLDGMRFRSVSAGGRHTALLAGDGAACWCGDDLEGQLGDGPADAGDRAVMAIAEGVVAVEAGALHTCAVLESGAIECWGENNNGRLGTGERGNI